MKLNIITAVAFKQFKDIFKNKTILLQFIIFPIVTISMMIAVPEQEIKQTLPFMFATMFIGLTPLTCMASIIAEEKEKNTLSSLQFAFVKPFEYLTGISIVIILACISINLIFSMLIDCSLIIKLKIFSILCLGTLPSVILGSVLGMLSKNQMSIASLVSPVSMIISMLPLFSSFNDNIKSISKFIYTQQISDILNDISNGISFQKISVILVNILIFVTLFIIIYKKKGLKSSD